MLSLLRIAQHGQMNGKTLADRIECHLVLGQQHARIIVIATSLRGARRWPSNRGWLHLEQTRLPQHYQS